ncbi:YcnI family protein [Bradyrhizobium sp. ORS 111]|uniref:YcnI family copper-binding membrane protein n=1 Tax=Bradyrhizobium sp. ORS 111 TaxID=1685958 RepID=UPI00388F42F2
MRRVLLAGAIAALAMSPAVAHITLEGKQAAIGSYYKAVFAVPHGCAGSATVKIRVQIPDGVIAVKPMPKPGWNVESISGKYATEYDYHGRKFSEGVKEVAWSGGKLADQNYDEFVMMTFLTDTLKPNTTLYFPVVQECEEGVSRWIDIPADGSGNGHSQGSKTPAPGVRLLPKS